MNGLDTFFLWSVSHSIQLTHRVIADGQSITSIYWESVILSGCEHDAELSHHQKSRHNQRKLNSSNPYRWRHFFIVNDHHLYLRLLYGFDRHYRYLHISHVLPCVLFDRNWESKTIASSWDQTMQFKCVWLLIEHTHVFGYW